MRQPFDAWIRCDSNQAKCLFFVSIHNQLYQNSMAIFVLIYESERKIDARRGVRLLFGIAYSTIKRRSLLKTEVE